MSIVTYIPDQTVAYDADGVRESGAKLTFYLYDTTTPTPVYQDPTGTPASNPVLSLSDGTWPEIYWNNEIRTRVIKTSPTGSTNPATWEVKDIGPIDGGYLKSDLSNVDASAEDGAAFLTGIQANAANINYTSNAITIPLDDKIAQEINLLDYIPANLHAGIVNGSNTTDLSAYIQAAFTAAAGRRIRATAGTYLLKSTINVGPTGSDLLGNGASLIGDGPMVTLFDNQVANGPAFAIATGVPEEFSLGSVFHGFGIITSATPANSSAITITSAYELTLSQILIDGMSQDGVRIICAAGDPDGSNNITIRQCWIKNCARWGINARADTGHNEISFLYLPQTRVEGCGTVDASDPPISGGMIYKGQIFTCEQTTFVTNNNVGLFIPGDTGLANSVALRETVFENNKSRAFYCTGVVNMTAENIHLYNNASFTASVLFEVVGSAPSAANVRVRNVIVRIDPASNPCMAFKLTGTQQEKESCRVTNVFWQAFDTTGQTRFSGWLFDTVPIQATLVAEASSDVLLKGWNGQGGAVPLRLGGNTSTTGEWVAYDTGAGVALIASGLANSTAYHAYLYDNSGLAALELSTTGPAIDAETGYYVKTGDATRTLVGGVTTNGSGAFNTTGNGWLMPTRIAGSQISAWMWVDGTGDVRIKQNTAPTSDTDGTVIGTQT